MLSLFEPCTAVILIWLSTTGWPIFQLFFCQFFSRQIVIKSRSTKKNFVMQNLSVLRSHRQMA